MAGEKAGSGKKRKKSELVATAGLIVIFILYMFPFYMVVINSLKQKRDIIKVHFPGCIQLRDCRLITS